MSESHGTVLILKHHEDLERVAKYVKQQVREKSLDLLGEDLSEDDKFVGLRIKEEENEIIWHDYGHHGTHLDFNPISESVINEFPDVEMERHGWWGQQYWNYFIADGKWQEYTLWKFVAYIDGKGEEDQLDFKQPKEGRTEEEKYEIRDKMCKEMAERISQANPGVVSSTRWSGLRALAMCFFILWNLLQKSLSGPEVRKTIIRRLLPK